MPQSGRSGLQRQLSRRVVLCCAFLHESFDGAARSPPIPRSTAAQPLRASGGRARVDLYGVLVAGEGFGIAFESEYHAVAAGGGGEVPGDFANLLQAVGGAAQVMVPPASTASPAPSTCHATVRDEYTDV